MVAARISGDPNRNNASPEPGRRGLFYIHTDHLGSASLMSDAAGQKVETSVARYLPYGGWRTEPTANLTDRAFTGQKENMDIGLYYYNARYYAPGAGRFISADTIVPDPTNPQQFNRYSYVLNNALRYTDPTGHYCYDPTFGDAAGQCYSDNGYLINHIPGKQPSGWRTRLDYPKNKIEGLCEFTQTLSDCFDGGIVLLQDFSGYGPDNPISFREFEVFANKVAADLHRHKLTWPGYRAGRGAYDTPFYNNGQSRWRARLFGGDPEGLWAASQEVCIDTIGCFGRSEVNYIAQGMWAAATGEPLPVSRRIVQAWKAFEYQELSVSDGTFFWLQWGYEYYQRWLIRQRYPDLFQE